MKLKEFLDNPDRWTRGSWARTKDGVVCRGSHEEACCWCLTSAIEKCYDDLDSQYAVIDRILAHLGLEGTIAEVVEWNDNRDRTFSDIKKLVEELDI